jgi:putative ABC transport system permease protein
MTWRDTLRAAWQGVTANVMRSVLTTLGILIGVAAVIVLVAVGNGSAKSVSDAISALGANTVTVRAGQGQATSFALTTAMAKALENKSLCPDIATVSPTVSASATASYGEKTSSIDDVIGTKPSWFAAQNQPVQIGSKFTTADVTAGSRVIVLATSTAEDLFGVASEAVGKEVRVGAISFRVIGVLKDQGAGPSAFQTTAVAPLTAIQGRLASSTTLSSIIVQAKNSDAVDATQAEVETVLRGLDHLSSSETDLPFQVQNASSFLETQESSSKTFTVLLGVVAGISLLVGGLGITNIMLVTVTERTREIGIRKALGAPKRTILLQFLLESSMLSLTGGLVGVALGLAISQLTIIGVTPIVMPASVALALGTSVLIGVLFGSLPANRAAGLRPVEALRHD